MNPSKVGKMDEEVQKWSRKDPQAIKKAMVYPGNFLSFVHTFFWNFYTTIFYKNSRSFLKSVNSGFADSLEALERGEMKYTGMGGGDTEAEVEDDVDVDPDADADPETDLDPEVELDCEIKEEVDDEEAIVEQVHRCEYVYFISLSWCHEIRNLRNVSETNVWRT